MDGHEPGWDTDQNEAARVQRLRRQLETESSDALALLACPEENPICSIVIDGAIPGVVITWKRYATSAQLRFIHEYALDLLKRHGLVKILGDDTSLPMIHAEDRAWITRDWLPRATAAGLRAAASKAPASFFGKLCVESIFSDLAGSLNVRSFNTMVEARTWLRET